MASVGTIPPSASSGQRWHRSPFRLRMRAGPTIDHETWSSLPGPRAASGVTILPGLLATGWEVHGVSSRDREQAAGPVRWHRADLLDASQTESLVATVRPSHLLHLGMVYRAREVGDGTRQPSLGARKSQPAAVVPGAWRHSRRDCRLLSRVRLALRLLCEERTPCQPHTIYGTCKHALQLLTTAHAASTGMSSAWARIFFLYGPYEHPARLVASVIRSVLEGEPAKCSHGLQIRDYLFVQDVADAMVALLESDVSGPINIASGQAITLRDIVTRAGTLLGRPELIQLGAIPAAATDTPLVVADTARAVRLLPSWRPKVSLDEGLQRTIDWWRQRHVTFEAHFS